MTTGRILFLVGIDGSGKSSIAERLVSLLRQQHIRADRGWARNRNYLSKLILGYTRLTDLNVREHHGGHVFQYYRFWRRTWVRDLYLRSQMVDIAWSNYWNLRRKSSRSQVLVCDRGPYDTIADVTLGTRLDLCGNGAWQRFLAFLPKEHQVFYLKRPVSRILQDRPELCFDRDLEQKARIYDDLSRHFGWPTLENTGSIEEACQQILSRLGALAC
jgi:thymidylate kinase